MPTRRDSERAVAARLLKAVVVDRQTSDQALARHPADPLTSDLFFGALRHYYTLGAEVDAALTRPLRQKDQVVWCLMIVGAYQLAYARIPDHAAINETVAACKALKRTSMAGLVNGVLRSLQRNRAHPKASTGDATERSFGPAEAHPEWMVGRLRLEYPDTAEAILAANLQRAPLTIRVNQRRIHPGAYRASLDAQNIGYAASFRDEYLVLDEPIPTTTLPGFAEGLVAVQDAGAGFAADLLTCDPGSRLLDACAAPGGKLFQLLECQPDLAAVALEKAPKRMQRLRAEARRLGHAPATLIGDATNLDWWDGRHFDAVLVDAPCSGSGTLRRHPDIKILRDAADLGDYARLQRALLSNLWRTLRPGGSLLYCTCSLFAEENDAVVADFLATTGDARVANVTLPTGIARESGWQLLPTDPSTDGFYFSLVKKD